MRGTVTAHAGKRLRQRGYRGSDLDVVLHHGTPAGNAVVMTDQDVDGEIAACRRRIQQLERLRGTTAILDGDTVLSVYRPRRDKMRRLLRARGGRGLGVARAVVEPVEQLVGGRVA